MFFCKDKNETAIMPPAWADNHPAWLRLENQLKWYDRKSKYSQRWYKGLKSLQVILAIGIPVAIHLGNDIGKSVAAISGALIAIMEAIQQMNQYSTLWVMYRATAERLKHEKYLFLAVAGPYKDIIESERLIVLAERVEEHVSTEHANWFSETRRIAADTKVDKK
jgi:hypothetical protein